MNIFSIITTISGLLIAIATILSTFKKFRKWIVNKLLEDIDFQTIDKRSSIYKMKEDIDKSKEDKETIIKNINNAFSEQKELFDDMKMSLLRLEIGRLLDHEPKNVDTIYKLYDKYVRMGGNSYMIERIKQWEKKLHDSKN